MHGNAARSGTWWKTKRSTGSEQNLVMSCWEGVLYLAYQCDAIGKADCTRFYQSATASDTKLRSLSGTAALSLSQFLDRFTRQEGAVARSACKECGEAVADAGAPAVQEDALVRGRDTEDSACIFRRAAMEIAEHDDVPLGGGQVVEQVGYVRHELPAGCDPLGIAFIPAVGALCPIAIGREPGRADGCREIALERREIGDPPLSFRADPCLVDENREEPALRR